MNNHYQTRLQTRLQSKSANHHPSISNDSFTHHYNTRIKNRLHKVDTNFNQYHHHYNTRSSSNQTYNVTFDFDESSRQWNKNKKRVGQMYEYI